MCHVVYSTRFAGFKAAYSYAIETYHDKEIWDLQRVWYLCALCVDYALTSCLQTLDEHVKNDVPEFNHERRPRLEWQNGETQGWQFYIRVPMFLPYQARGEKPKAPDRLHDWVKVAHARTRSYRANPNRPQVRAVEDGEIRDIARCAKPRLEYGDVVGLVFTVVYVETPANWSPVYMLTDIIRVMHANRDSYPLAAPDEFDDAVTDDGALSVTNVTPGAQRCSTCLLVCTANFDRGGSVRLGACPGTRACTQPCHAHRSAFFTSSYVSYRVAVGESRAPNRSSHWSVGVVVHGGRALPRRCFPIKRCRRPTGPVCAQRHGG